MVAARARTLPLVERMRPTRLDELVGNPRARAELKAWADAWKAPRPPGQRAVVLAGPAGVGKTSAALAIAAEYGWTLVEMNASDARNEHAVEQIAGRAAITHTLGDSVQSGDRRHALILLDEADSLSGRASDGPRPKPEPTPLRDFLRGRYRNIESLNSAYGLRAGGKPPAFTAWDDLPRTPGNAGWARLPAARRDIEEWREAGRVPDTSDRGGAAAIARLVRTTRQPIILTVNDERELTRHSAAFRTAVRRIRFYPIRDRELEDRLEQIVRSERLRPPPGAIPAIVRRARGDLRAALNDLDAITSVPPEQAQLSVLGARDLLADLEALTEEVLSVPRFYRSIEIQDRLDAPPDELLPWIEENLPHFAPDAVHRDRAFARLVVAARFLDRARRARVWSQWSFGSEIQTGGVALAIRDQPASRTSGVAFPQYLGKMGGSRNLRAVRDSLAGKVGARLHLSRRKTREWVMPFLEGLFASPRGSSPPRSVRPTLVRITRELAMTPEELAYLLDCEPDDARVASLLSAPEETLGSEPEPSTGTRPSAGRGPQRQLSEFDA